ncbi:hypothetical protein L1987_51705 [Smallanthus sonchifolius]|uniref:Uncharacterized protein n=1 Tax=Smallanthus sonchifolius TaxID=185202 RepID=A0ACB9ERP9_9ASTR|nr:hypothetical protein L1987_51705 [Smallanthus sonchifolius]
MAMEERSFLTYLTNCPPNYSLLCLVKASTLLLQKWHSRVRLSFKQGAYLKAVPVPGKVKYRSLQSLKPPNVQPKLTLSESTSFVVKKLRRESTEHDRGLHRELESMGKIMHRNIVTLYGYYTKPNCNFLIHELMPDGSLDAHSSMDDQWRMFFIGMYSIAFVPKNEIPSDEYGLRVAGNDTCYFYYDLSN